MKWILFPPPAAQKFQPGDHVFIKTKSRKEIGRKGVVIAANCDDKHQTQDEFRVWVRIPSRLQVDDKNSDDQSTNRENPIDQFFTTSFRPNRLVKVIDDSVFEESDCRVHEDHGIGRTIVAITATTEKYRLLATSQIQSTDHVLEIGCSNGECSLVIAKYLSKGSLVAFDTSREMISQAQEKMSRQQNDIMVNNAQFHVVDPFIEPRKALLLATGGEQGQGEKLKSKKISVVLIDIGGNRDLESVLKMLAWVRETFSTLRLCIIKSKQMVDEVMADSYCVDMLKESSKDEQLTSTTKRLKTRPIICIQPSGVLTNGEVWFHAKVDERILGSTSSGVEKTTLLLAPRFSHPKRAPLSLSPKDGKTPICRYYNYHKNGCIKSDCTNDHEHCHWCLIPGHIALNCTNKQE
jgi:SAM-dependent methyltransferase